MQRHPRGIDSLSTAQFAGVTFALSLLAFALGGIVEAATLVRAHAAAPAALEPLAGSAGPAAPSGPAAGDAPGAAELPVQPQPVILEGGGELREAPAEPAPAPAQVEQIDGRTAPALVTQPDSRVTDGASAPTPQLEGNPDVAVIDLARAPVPDPSAGSPVAVIDGSAPQRGGSVEVIDGHAVSVALGTVAARAQWGIASTVDVIDGSAAHVLPRTSS